MVLMIIYIHSKNSSRQHLIPSLVELGLVLSLVGDVMLMFDEDSAFMIGTLFFAAGHIVYIIAFRMGGVVKEIATQLKIMRIGVYLLISGLTTLNIFLLW